jgi:HEAT repeat protein
MGMVKPLIPAIIGVVLLPLALVLYGQISSQQLTSESPSLRQAALRQLAALSVPEKSRQLPELVGLLRGKEANRIVLAFAKIGPSAVPTLMNLLDDPDRGVRGFAAQAIATFRPSAPEAIDKLRLMLKDRDTWVQRRVAESLLSIGTGDEDAQSIVREEWKYVGFPLIRSKPPGTISDWLQSLSSDDPVVVHDAVSSLKDAGEAAVPSLIAALKSNYPTMRIGAAETLQMMHLYRADIEAACIQALQDPSARVREFARNVLLFQVSEAAMDALLQDDIAEIARKRAIELRAQNERAQPHTLAGVLAAIPSDPDNNYPLEVTDQFVTKSPDGTVLLTVLHTGKERGDLLRIWRFRQAAYYLVKEDNAEPRSHLSAGGFHYQGKAYLHVMWLTDGTGYEHEDDFFRIESGGLTKLTPPKGLPLVLAPGEGVWKGFSETFKDDDLEFQFGIWKNGDANCCPTAGRVKGTYTIAGDELKYATWNRSKDVPQ